MKHHKIWASFIAVVIIAIAADAILIGNTWSRLTCSVMVAGLSLRSLWKTCEPDAIKIPRL